MSNGALIFAHNNPIIDYLRSPIESLRSKSIEEYISILKIEFREYILNLELSCQYFRIIDEMFDKGEIQIENREDGGMLISETRSGAKVDLKNINKEEQKLIKNIEEKWKGKKTTAN